jgi:metallo-beta-lactamase family protein
MKMTFIGATHEVTGSCTYLEVCGRRILVDFGMEQGRDTYENVRIPCAPGEIDYVLLTHAHIDHSGLLPLLYAGGFTGEIHTTTATASLCDIMLRDSAHIQEFEAEWHNRKAMRRGDEPYVPLYTMEDALGALKLFQGHPYEETFLLFPGVQVRFLDAGHLLGSSSIELWLTESGVTKKLVFSGDIGNLNQPLIRDPQPPEEADYVVMESTYGNRLHEKPKGYLPGLVQVLRDTFTRGGSVIIPSFAVGRTQELLYYFKQIKDQNLLPEFGNFPIYMDSPLAIDATEIFMHNKESCFDEEALSYVQRGENPIGVTGLIPAETSDDSKAINADKRPKVILSASGMCEAGRIKHHLKHNLWKPENTILFVGYQAEGSLGRRILEGAKTVTLFGETVQVSAQIVQLPGMSGHADQKGLLQWIGAVHGVQKVFVNHGNTDSADAFREKLWQTYGLDAYAPYSGAEFDLASGKITYDAAPVPVAQKAKRSGMTYDRLTQTLSRLSSLVQSSRGLSNKELAKMADQLNELCNKWERK